MSSPPFIDQESRELDLGQIRDEACPLAGLIVLFGALALLVFLMVLLVAGNPLIAGVLTILTQFILAVGTGIVLIYVIARGIQLADQGKRARYLDRFSGRSQSTVRCGVFSARLLTAGR